MKRQRITPYLLLLPGLFPIVAFMSLVVGMAVSQSIGYFNFAGDDRFSLEFWEGMLSQNQFWRVFWYSARIAILSSLISVMLAYPVALWLRRPFPGSDLISAMIKAPLLVHGLVAAFLFVNFISFQGFLNVALVKLGRTAEAAERAETFLRRYPSGPFAHRVRKLAAPDAGARRAP